MAATPPVVVPQPDVAAISRWLQRFTQAPGHVLASWKSDGYKAHKVDPASLEEEAQGLAQIASSTETYVRVTTTTSVPTSGRGSVDDSAALIGLWADLDHAEGCHNPAETLVLPPNREACLGLLDTLPAPTVVIDTTGGLQAWWMFDQPQPIDHLGGIDAATTLTQGWHQLVAGKAAEHGWHVDNVADLARILRIPGTLNHKWTKTTPTQPPRLVTILTEDGPTYPLAVARELINAATPATPVTAPKADISPAPVTPDPAGDTKLFAADGEDLAWWEQRTTWEDLLCPHGWTVYQRRAGGETWWTRPNADRTTTPKSAVTGYRGHDVLTVHTSASDLPSGPGQGLTKLRVYAHYSHGGDLEAAGKAVKAMWREAHPLPAIMPTVIEMPLTTRNPKTREVDGVERPLLASRRAHSDNATRWLIERAHRDGLPVICYRDGQWWAWTDGCWRPQRDEDITDAMRPYFDQAVVLDKDKNPIPVAPDNALMANLLTALRAQARHHGLTGDPWETRWINHRPDGYPPADELIPFINGLLHWPTRTLYPLTARLWCTWRLPAAWQPQPGPPDAILSILNDQFHDQPDAIDTLQELAGYCIVGDTWAEKMFGLIGEKRSGKSTFAEALSVACGIENTATMSASAFDSEHGTSNLPGKKLILLNETRTSGKAAGAVRDLLSISGGDPIQVNQKYRDPAMVKVKANVLAHSNELPTFLEASGALAGRFIWIHFTRSFYGQENPELKRQAVAQVVEFIEWGLRGYERLKARGQFVQPASGVELAEDFADASNPVRRFVLENYEVGHLTESVNAKEVYLGYRTWCTQNGHGPMNATGFTRSVKAAFGMGEVRMRKRREGSEIARHWYGLRRLHSPLMHVQEPF